jgi:hypothetical protein
MYQRIFDLLIRKRRKQICITTYFDDAFSSIGNLCSQTIRQYAEQHRMDAVLLNRIASDRPAPWNKILVVKELFSRGYEFVFWIDADAIFVDFTRSIEDVIDPGKNLYLVKHKIDSNDVPNTGSFLIRNNAWSHAFLDTVWEKHEYIHHKWWENAAVIDIFGYHSLLHENQPDSFNRVLLAKVKWLGLEWNSLPGICEAENPIIKHYAGRSLDFRISNMTHDAKIMQGLKRMDTKRG